MASRVPVNRAVRAAPTPAPSTAAPKSSSRMTAAAAPAKSMRQLNKENEDLQVKVEELSHTVQSLQAGKQAVKAAYEKSAKEKDGVIEGLKAEMEAVQGDLEHKLSSTKELLQKAQEEASEQAARTEEAEEIQRQLNKRAGEYASCLESVGVNAVSLKEWTQRDAEKQQDVVMLEEQIQKAMDDLKGTRKALEDDVAREEDFLQKIESFREQLKSVSEKDLASDGEEELGSEALVEQAPNDENPPIPTGAELDAALDDAKALAAMEDEETARDAAEDCDVAEVQTSKLIAVEKTEDLSVQDPTDVLEPQDDDIEFARAEAEAEAAAAAAKGSVVANELAAVETLVAEGQDDTETTLLPAASAGGEEATSEEEDGAASTETETETEMELELEKEKTVVVQDSSVDETATAWPVEEEAQARPDWASPGPALGDLFEKAVTEMAGGKEVFDKAVC